MLPNFFVIGAPRSGTTSAYEYLRAHPDVYMSTVKEPNIFAEPEFDLVEATADGGAASLYDRARAFPRLAAHIERYEAMFKGAAGQRRLGEASALYLGHPTAAAHIRRYLPDARLVAILRDPADRAYSHLVHGSRIIAEAGRTTADGANDGTVAQAFRDAVATARAHGMPDPGVSDPEIWVRSGFYCAHLRRWFSLFPREQMQVHRFEDFATDPDAVMQQVFEFLGIDPFVLPTTEAFNASIVPRSKRLFSLFTTNNPLMRSARSIAPPRVRALAMRTRNRLLGSEKPALPPSLRADLVAIYRDDVIELQDLLGWDLSDWLRA